MSSMTLSQSFSFVSLRERFSLALGGLFSRRNALLLGFALLASLLAMFDVTAATTEGAALEAAYNSLDDLANGYGKQILTLMGFVIAAVSYFGANSASAVFKFIGYAIFLGAALGAAVTLVGAVI